MEVEPKVAQRREGEMDYKTVNTKPSELVSFPRRKKGPFTEFSQKIVYFSCNILSGSGL